jgi:hypothetical protein
MFDEMIAKPKARRWQTAVIVGSALAHAAVFGAVAIAAMWKIDKLELGETVDITYRVAAPQGSSAPPPAATLEVLTPEPTVVKKPPPPVIVQPTVVNDPEPVTTTGTAGTDTGAKTGGPGGDGDDPDADPDRKGRCTTPGACIEGHDGDPPVVEQKRDKVIADDPPILPPAVAKGLRYAGNDQIHPPERVRVDMMHQGKDRLLTTVQLCVDVHGNVSTLRVRGSSGFPSYDDKILREMRDWKYRPYLVNKMPSPMCTVTMFDYRMRR